MGRQTILTEEQEQRIVYNYTILHYGQKKAGAFIPVSDSVVRKVLVKHGVHIKSIQETNVNKFWVNHNYFQTQSADLGYWIGILGSDGSVARDANQIYIELQIQDRELLEKLNVTIENERPVKDYITAKGYENSKLYFHSKQIKEDLAKFKIIPNKTYDSAYGFPYKLQREFYWDYIRGLFDGDGCVKQGNSITWQIDTGSKEIAQEIKKFLHEEGIEAEITSLPKRNVTIFRVYCYGKTKLFTLYNKLYSTSSQLYLARKKAKFEELLNL